MAIGRRKVEGDTQKQSRRNECGLFAEEDWTQHNTRSQILFFFFKKGGNITYINGGLSAGCCGNHNFEFSG